MIKTLEEKSKTKNEASNLTYIECKVCKIKYKQDKELKNDIVNALPKTLKCKNCDRVFDLSWKLETHLKTGETD